MPRIHTYPRMTWSPLKQGIATDGSEKVRIIMSAALMSARKRDLAQTGMVL